MASIRIDASEDEDGARPQHRLTPGAEMLVNQTADLAIRTLPHLGSISVATATYEYRLGFFRAEGGGHPYEVPTHALLRIDRDQTIKGGAGLLPVWIWRDKRRLVAAMRTDTGEPVAAVEVPYTDANDTYHVPMFRVDGAAREAFLSESTEMSAAIARRTHAMLRTMVQALERSPLTSSAAIRRDYGVLELRDADLRSDAVKRQLALVDPDIPLDGEDPRRLTRGIQDLQRMLVFCERVVLQESGVVAAAIREAFCEIQGRRPVGWQRWLPGSAPATYATGSDAAVEVSVPVLVYHDRERRAVQVLEPAPGHIPGKGDLVEGWTVRPFDGARLLNECEQIAEALTAERNESHRSIAGKVGGAFEKFQRLRR